MEALREGVLTTNYGTNADFSDKNKKEIVYFNHKEFSLRNEKDFNFQTQQIKVQIFEHLKKSIESAFAKLPEKKNIKNSKNYFFF